VAGPADALFPAFYRVAAHVQQLGEFIWRFSRIARRWGERRDRRRFPCKWWSGRFVVDLRYVTRYALDVIRGTRHKGLKRLYEDDDARGVHGEHAEKLRDILARLDAAKSITDLEVPGFRLHALKGDYRGYWAVVVRANWRVVFRFEDGDALDVDYVDYH
jgi:toxin HigB-1